MQVKLLRVLQEHEVRPVGSLQRVRVEIRVIAATNRNLEKEVAAGRFREDLFHRLNVIRLTLPPLRERKEDIPLLIERFLGKVERRYVIAREAMDAIVAYDWPGNIRELRNCLDRMMAFNSGPLLTYADLPTNVAFNTRARTLQGMAAVSTAAAPGLRPMVTPGCGAAQCSSFADGRSAPGTRTAGHSARTCPHKRRSHGGGATARHRPHHPLPQAQGIRAGVSALSS